MKTIKRFLFAIALGPGRDYRGEAQLKFNRS
jgi:hypothetical protein